ncbi:hypothetical protein HCN44_008143 [Aphidius gifuensis]|uniref:Alkyl transferase n=1 Tax=Aphidius gifuensis TaxID=684658 RepID=A0A834XQB5_APHGI|nr:dehydrodolichyl diphosphate synthase complex subunit DHDDS [Aphidius gifuensis]KAF7989469.1 hypothetical protein HCN44_008143 [Aphidius gifuensis]
MSWIRDSTLNFFQMLAVKIVKTGKVPKHVAFIMDGNRRYADKKNVAGLQGHTAGFDKLAETLQWCLDLGIKIVTVYAFSIENFKRTKKEVDDLIELAVEKFQRLLDEKDKLMEHGVRVNIVGNMSLIPDRLRKLMAEAMTITKDNNKAMLNVAFAYTSRDEMTETIKTLTDGVCKQEINPADIDEDVFTKCMYTYQSPPPDLLIRTSGEVRFSDFLLWQISHSYIYFANVLWPEFNIWNLLTAVFHYQRSYDDLNKSESKKYSYNQTVFSTCANKYVNNLHDKRHIILENLASQNAVKS